MKLCPFRKAQELNDKRFFTAFYVDILPSLKEGDSYGVQLKAN